MGCEDPSSRLLLDGPRKSIEPLAYRLGVHNQALHHFVAPGGS